MSNEEQRRPDGEDSREQQHDVPDSPPETPDPVSEPIEMGGSEDPGVIPHLADEAFDEEPEAEPEEEAELAREEVVALATELAEARRERDAYLDDVRRMKAEMENAKKRLERDRARFVQSASESLVRELLPVLDNLDRALTAEGDIRGGVRATREQLVSVLAEQGLTPVESDGEPFDPVVHEAVMGQPSDEHEEDTIIQTLERGYTLNGRAIRPAKVIVAKQV
ncbi:MAG: Heat shock protein GrpE [uncultured Rubrobacteraceae bacterium]|uniref:Protein GrpE n=1 Tax=uncultured Rubrobacteraceae bacterium TaxID=349277 RepID=A0A6J4R3T0_9ACTN|nr:MAG: Heat shock protein GrpE [uncultured Rubrobacteraceae bacterium]